MNTLRTLGGFDEETLTFIRQTVVHYRKGWEPLIYIKRPTRNSAHLHSHFVLSNETARLTESTNEDEASPKVFRFPRSS